jgi:hypothetical protein
MAKQFTTGFSSNALIVVESLCADESKTGKYLHDDLHAFLHEKRLKPFFEQVSSAAEFRSLMAKLTIGAQQHGLAPILHLEVHGSEDRKGLIFQPSADFLGWPEFADLARQLNEATHNNLMVTMGVCHGFHAVLALKIAKPAPFCELVGTQETVMNVALRKAFGPFYRRLLENNDLSEARKELPKGFLVFSCEELFVKSIIRYFRESATGKGRLERIERLVTQARLRAPQMELRKMRRLLKKNIRPSPDVFERYRRVFLLSDYPDNRARFTVRYKDVLSAIGLTGDDIDDAPKL